MKKIVFIVVLIVILLSLVPTSVAFAEVGTIQGSDVLTDLSGDSSFSQQYYPIDNSNYSLSIITIAESVNNELLLYVYQPCVNYDFRANYISISTTINDNVEFVIKSLTFCNKSGTLYKYVVDGLTVNQRDEVRYYEIASIYRPFDSSIDSQAMYDNEVNAVSFGVSKCWKIGEINGNSYVECSNIQTVIISNKYVGFCRYSDGASFFHHGEATDAHFVAFSTNYDIDDLYEADVWFKTQSYHIQEASISGPIVRNGEYGDEVEHFKTCYSDEYVQRESGYWLADDYGFYRVMSTSAFIESEMSSANNVYVQYVGLFINLKTTQSNELTSAALSALENTQWVLRFYETDYWSYWTTHPGLDEVYMEDSTSVTSVTILRLKFKSNGVVYNLGCIDNMQTGGSVPANVVNQTTEIELSDELKDLFRIFLIILAVIAILFLLYLLSPVFRFIWLIVTLPFKAIKRLVGKGKEIHSEQAPRAPSRYRYRR